jgi:hypothetical protein
MSTPVIFKDKSFTKKSSFTSGKNGLSTVAKSSSKSSSIQPQGLTKTNEEEEEGLDLTTSAKKNENGEDDDDNLLGKKRKRVARKIFSPQDLISSRGMWHLYDKMLKRTPSVASSILPAQKVSKNPVTEDLKNVMEIYRSWARQLNPGKNALDTLEKCGEWGGKNVIKDVLSRMRLELEIPRAIDSVTPQISKYMESTELARLRAEEQAKSRRDGIKKNMPTFGGVDIDDDRRDEDPDDKPDEEEEDSDYFDDVFQKQTAPKVVVERQQQQQTVPELEKHSESESEDE